MKGHGCPKAQGRRERPSHLKPAALGGLTVAANLWPKPNIEAKRKDRLEVEMQRRACAAYRTLQPAEAAAVLAGAARDRRQLNSGGADLHLRRRAAVTIGSASTARPGSGP